MENLSYLGRKEAEYVLKEARTVLGKASGLQTFIEEENITAKYLSDSLFKPDVALAAKGKAHTTIHTWIEIYETLANRLSQSLSRPLEEFPHLTQWGRGVDAETYQREWRNKCAHNAGVPRTFKHDDQDTLNNRCFDPKDFLEFAEQYLGPLIKDLTALVQVIEQDIESYPVHDETKNWSEVADMLVEERQHPEMLVLQEKLDHHFAEEQQFGVFTYIIKAGEMDLRQKSAAKLFSIFRNCQKKADNQANAVLAQKLRLAEDIYKAEQAAIAQRYPTQWSTETTDGEGDIAAAWQQRFDANAAAEEEEFNSFVEGQPEHNSETDTAGEQGPQEVFADAHWGSISDQAVEEPTDEPWIPAEGGD